MLKYIILSFFLLRQFVHSETCIQSNSTQQKEPLYTFPLRNGFNPGTMVRIKGFTLSNGSRFSVSLHEQGQDEINWSDIVYHVSVRYGQDLIVLNSREESKWLPEVRANSSELKAGTEFDILIACEPTQFRLAINGRLFPDFKMRKSSECIKAFSIEGDVTVSTISFNTATLFTCSIIHQITN